MDSKYLHFTVICKTKLPMQELELKMQGVLMHEGGYICGVLYGTWTSTLKEHVPVHVP